VRYVQSYRYLAERRTWMAEAERIQDGKELLQLEVLSHKAAV